MPRDFEGNFCYQLTSERLFLAAHDHAVIELMREEVERQLREDPDMRVLLKEMVRDAISRMNLQEVVDAAVRNSLERPAPKVEP